MMPSKNKKKAGKLRARWNMKMGRRPLMQKYLDLQVRKTVTFRDN